MLGKIYLGNVNNSSRLIARVFRIGMAEPFENANIEFIANDADCILISRTLSGYVNKGMIILYCNF